MNELLIDYLKAIENPDRIGWDSKTKRWIAPALKGYDKNQRGYGIDIVTNNAARKLTEGRPGRWLTDDEVNMLMNKHIDYITGVARKHVKGFDSFSPEKQAALLGMLYRGDSINGAAKKGLINLNEKDDRKFIDSVNNYYSTVGVSERGRSSRKFFNNYYAQREPKKEENLSNLMASNNLEEVPVSTRVERVSITPAINMKKIPENNSYVLVKPSSRNLEETLDNMLRTQRMLSDNSIPSTATPPYVSQMLLRKRGGKLLLRKLINKLK